jgi:membrane-associated phospholipid phosphatase
MEAKVKFPFRRTFYNILLPVIWVLSFQISSAQNFDINLLRNINIGHNTSLDPAFRGVTNSVAPLMIVTPIIMFGAGYFKNDPVLKRNAIVTGASLLTSLAITNALKYTIDRPRPFEKYPDIERATRAVSPSFPSGHTSSAFALATSLSIAYPKWYIIVPSYSWAIMVAYSRMHLGVHYPSDVVVGVLIGIGSSFLCYKINERIMQNPQ